MVSFRDAQSVTELVHQLVGAGSMCWLGETGDAVFETETALQVGEAEIERLAEPGWT